MDFFFLLWKTQTSLSAPPHRPPKNLAWLPYWYILLCISVKVILTATLTSFTSIFSTFTIYRDNVNKVQTLRLIYCYVGCQLCQKNERLYSQDRPTLFFGAWEARIKTKYFLAYWVFLRRQDITGGSKLERGSGAHHPPHKMPTMHKLFVGGSENFGRATLKIAIFKK